MNAIELLETQHRDVDELFARLERREGKSDARSKMFDELADLLAIHASIEEMHFYPAVKEAAKAQRTEEILEHSLEEHLDVKRKLALTMMSKVGSVAFYKKLGELKHEVQHHVKEEREELFPKVRRILNTDQLEALGQEMTSTMAQLQQGNPRRDVPLQTIAPMPLMDPPPAQTGIGSRVFPHIGRLLALPMEMIGAVKKVKNVASGFVAGVQRGMKRKRPA
jgi:hemerythrin superfamily protein